MTATNDITVRKAVIPVAGMGTRFFPVTKRVPKALLPVLATPLIQHAVQDAVDAGIQHIVIVEDTNPVADYFDPSPTLEATLRQRGKPELADQLRDISQLADVSAVLQPEPLGLGHAVLLARDLIGDEPFAVLLPDEILWSDGPSATAQLLAAKAQHGGTVIGLMPTPWDDVHTKGIVDGTHRDDGTIDIDVMVEKPTRDVAPSNLAIVGRYVFDATIFERLAHLETGAGGEIQLTDAMAASIGDEPVHGVLLDATRFDAGVPEGMFGAALHQAAHDPTMRQMILRKADDIRAADAESATSS